MFQQPINKVISIIIKILVETVCGCGKDTLLEELISIGSTFQNGGLGTKLSMIHSQIICQGSLRMKNISMGSNFSYNNDVPLGHKETHYHMVFDVKITLVQKAQKSPMTMD